MIRKSAYLIALVIIIVFTGCPEINNPEFTNDPNPVEDPSVLPSPAEDLYIVANVGGTIYGVDSSDPLSYTILVADASIEENFSDIRISPNKKYLLYANNNKDLILFNIETTEAAIIAENIASNESEFIDNTQIFYTIGGSVRVYVIGSDPKVDYLLLPHEDNRCNHRAQLSPDKDRIVYKDQWTTTNIGGIHAWSPVVIGDQLFHDPVEIFQYNSAIDLYESFYYCWRGNDRVIFKNEPGLSSELNEKNVTGGISTNAVLQQSGVNILFEKLKISPNLSDPNLLIYGGNGLYMLNLSTDTEITGFIEPFEIYSSPFKTKYAAFGTNSLSFVVGTDNWMGIYNTEGLEKTNVSIENIFGDYGTLYALDCR